ncbi:MAG TPA: TonB-dependent receptor [Burkholderiales bacterium]|nr:TonB-dependent receptor [Burkholderiales bacterium]
MRRHRATLLCVLLFLPPAAAAQQAADEGAVTVTATRTERPSLEVPASIDQVYGDEIHFARPEVNLSESLGLVPGIVAQNRQNYAQDLQISSRGFGARATFGIRGLSLLVDGIPASMPDGQGEVSHVDLGSTDRIEVLRGPFAVMYGNASGGVINVFTRDGSSEQGADARLEAGSFGMQRESIEAGARSGSMDWLASGAHFQTDGFRNHSEAQREQGNAKLRFGLGGDTTFTLVANSFDSPGTQDPLGLTRAQVAADPSQAGTNAIAQDTRKSIRQNQAGGTLEHRFGDNTLSANFYSGQRNVNQFLALTTNGVVDLATAYSGGGLRLTHDGALAGRPLTLTLGGEYQSMDQRRKGFDNNSGVEGALRRDEDDTVSSSALYAQAEWRFAAKWIALGGVRANRVSFGSTDYYIVPGNPDDSGSRDFSATTPVLGILYRLAPATSLYANAGRGFETPTFAEMAYKSSGAPGLNFALDPAKSRHYETGIKTLVGSNLRLNAALYDVETEDEIVVDTNVGGRSTYKNAGKTRRRGIELGAGATLPFGIEAALAWTVLDATILDSYTSSSGNVAAGNVLPGVPRASLDGELRWRHVPSGFNAVLELQHRSRIAVNDRNSDFADGYTVANLALGFAQRANGWQLSEFLRVDNLADRQYVGSVIVNASNTAYFEPAPGRNSTVGVQARHGF